MSVVQNVSGFKRGTIAWMAAQAKQLHLNHDKTLRRRKHTTKWAKLYVAHLEGIATANPDRRVYNPAAMPDCVKEDLKPLFVALELMRA